MIKFHSKASVLVLSAATVLLSACGAGPHEGLEDGVSGELADEDSLAERDGVVLGTTWQALSYATCLYPWSDPDGDGWGWEFYKSCKMATTTSAPTYPTCMYPWSDPDGDGWGWEQYKSCKMSTSSDSSSDDGPSDDSSSDDSSSGGSTNTNICSNLEGTASTMAAVAVSAAMELARWQPTKDFTIGRVSGQEGLVLTATGRARCSDGVCFNTQALLDLQKDEANGNVVFPNNVTLNSPALRSRMVAKFRDQMTCEQQPSNGGTTNCPVEEHTLTFQRSEKGGCDTNFFFVARKPDGSALRYPGQLKNKLKWVDTNNPYVGFQNVGEVVSIDPTYGLNQAGSTSTGSCTAACVKMSSYNIAGQCCSCNGRTRAYTKSPWSSTTFLCR